MNPCATTSSHGGPKFVPAACWRDMTTAFMATPAASGASAARSMSLPPPFAARSESAATVSGGFASDAGVGLPLLLPPRQQQLGDQAGPAGLMGSAEPLAGVAVEILV